MKNTQDTAHFAVHISDRNLRRRVIVRQERRPNGTFLSPSGALPSFGSYHLTVNGKVVRND